ncbi:MAG: hypothetical protein U1D30_12980 [Planctomycetota bacterium]
MEMQHFVHSLAYGLEFTGGACLLWNGMAANLPQRARGEFLLLLNLAALGIVSLFAASIHHECALTAGMAVVVLLLAVLRKVRNDLLNVRHIMDEPIDLPNDRHPSLSTTSA